MFLFSFNILKELRNKVRPVGNQNTIFIFHIVEVGECGFAVDRNSGFLKTDSSPVSNSTEAGRLGPEDWRGSHVAWGRSAFCRQLASKRMRR
jgi:hypothetical protein